MQLTYQSSVAVDLPTRRCIFCRRYSPGFALTLRDLAQAIPFNLPSTAPKMSAAIAAARQPGAFTADSLVNHHWSSRGNKSC
jgi:hypothetical protein